MRLKIFAVAYATVVLMLGVSQWLSAYAGQPRSGRLLGTMLMFYGTCVLAEKISQQPHAEELIQIGSCVVLTVLLMVMSA
jgi:hypothetical protein